MSQSRLIDWPGLYLSTVTKNDFLNATRFDESVLAPLRKGPRKKRQREKEGWEEEEECSGEGRRETMCEPKRNPPFILAEKKGEVIGKSRGVATSRTGCQAPVITEELGKAARKKSAFEIMMASLENPSKLEAGGGRADSTLKRGPSREGISYGTEQVAPFELAL